MTTREEILSRINVLERYFLKNYSAGQNLFLPEYKVSLEIGKILQKENKLTLMDIEEIIKIHNSIKDTDHYEGSGWMDYQMQLLNLIKQDGVKVVLDDSDQMNINVD